MPPTLLNVGDRAPDFSLKDSEGKTFKLSTSPDGRAVVLIFYPGDMTPGCTMQLCAIRDEWAEFQDQGILVLGVNHGDKASHEKFIEKHKLPMRLLIDPQKKVSALYGAVRSILGLKIIRRTVIGIDKDGIVRYRRSGMPKNSAILKAMKPYSK